MRGIEIARGAAIGWLLCCATMAGENPLETGIAAFREGRYATALPKLEQAAKQNSDPIASAFLGMTKAALGNCPEALPLLARVPETQAEVYRLANLSAAKCYSAVNDESKAFGILTALERRYPRDADVLYLRAKLHMKAFNDATLAMFQRAPASYRVHELSAEVFEVQNRYGEAVEEYRKAIELNPAASDLHFRLGRALLMQNHEKQSLEEARAAFQAEQKINPEDAACDFQLGQIAQVQGQAPEAKAHFERALELSPNFVQALLALGKIETQERHWDKAIALLARAAELQPSNETAHYALLTAYRNSGDMEKAKAEKQKLEELQKPPQGEFSDFLKKLGAKKPEE